MKLAHLTFVAGFLIQIPWTIDAALLERNYNDSTGELSLVAAPDTGTAVYAVEEQLPDGLSARRVSDGGAYDPFLNKLKWGPFLDDQQRTLTCVLVTTEEASVTFSGQASWDGSLAQAATGDSSGVVPVSGFYSWILAEFGQEAFFQPGSRPSDDSDADRVTLLEEYVFGMNPSVVDKRVLDVFLGSGSEQMELRIQKRSDLGNVQLSYWESPDLSNWSAFDPGEAQVLEELGDGLREVRYTWSNVGFPDFIQLRLAVTDEEN